MSQSSQGPQGAVLVLGMHRSGTSALTRGLEVLGIDLGRNLKEPVPGDNDKGFFEDWALSTINDELMALKGGRWDSLAISALSKSDEDAINVLKLRALTEIERAFSDSIFFAFKDPRTSRTLPFWKDVLARRGVKPFYIVAFRNPMSVADSLAARDGFDRRRSYHLWLLHTLSAVKETEGEARVFVDFDELVEDPETVLKRVAAMIDDPRIVPGAQALQVYKREFLDRELRRHHNQNNQLDLDRAASTFVNDVYALLRREAAAGALGQAESHKAWEPKLRAFESLGPHLEYADVLDRDLREAVNSVAAKAGEIQHLRDVINGLNTEIGHLRGAREADVAALSHKLAQIAGASSARASEQDAEIARLRARQFADEETIAALKASIESAERALDAARGVAEEAARQHLDGIAALRAAHEADVQQRLTLAQEAHDLFLEEFKVQAEEEMDALLQEASTRHAEERALAIIAAVDDAIEAERRQHERDMDEARDQHASAMTAFERDAERLMGDIEARLQVLHEEALEDVRRQMTFALAEERGRAVQALEEERRRSAQALEMERRHAAEGIDAEAARGAAAMVSALEHQRDSERTRLEALQQQIDAVQQDAARRVREYETGINRLRDDYEALAHRLRSTYASSSWRWSKPLRAIKGALSGGGEPSEHVFDAPFFATSGWAPPRIDVTSGAQAATFAPAPLSNAGPKRRVHFTICAKNYLPIARTCLSTSAQHHPDAEHYLVLCDAVDQGYDPGTEPFAVIPVTDLPLPLFDDMKLRYDVMELNTAIKPFCFAHFFNGGADEVVYLDPDLYFLQRMDAVRDALASGAEAVLTPHIHKPILDDRSPGDIDMLRAGVYNLGFLALRRSPAAEHFAAWWGERLRTGAISDIARGLFTDQKWCDLLPCFVPHTTVLQHPGYNLAYWNLMHRPVHRQGDTWTAAGQPVVFVHFSGASFVDANVFSKHQNRYDADAIGELRALYDQYRDEVRANGFGVGPSYRYSFDFDGHGRRIAPVLRQLYRDEIAFAGPYAAPDMSRVLTLANEDAPDVRSIGGVRISRLMHRIWKSRPDLQAAFDLATESGQRGFLDWSQHAMPREYHLDASVYPVSLSPPPTPETPAPAQVTPSAISQISRSVLENSASLRPLYKHLPVGLRHRAKVLLTKSAYTPRGAAHHDEGAEPQPGAALIGYARGELGMGEHVRMTAAAMEHEGVPIGMINLSSNVLARQEDRRFDYLIDRAADFRANVFHVNADQLPLVCAELGDHFMEGKWNIAYPAWELAEFPKAWVPQLNRMDEIWAPSLFIRDSLVKSIDTPVIHMPLAVEIAHGYETWTRADFGLPGDAFVFLFYFDLASFASRKNPIATLQAFQLMLNSLSDRRDLDRVRLVVKVLSVERFPTEYSALKLLAESSPSVVLLPDVFSADKIHGLVNCADAFVSLHRSEGFGRGPAEAMRLGKAVIATGYSGNMDYMDASNSFPVSYQLCAVDRGEYPFGEGQYWADPNLQEASELMRQLIENPGLASEVGERARIYMGSHHNRAAIGKRYAERLKAIGALE